MTEHPFASPTAATVWIVDDDASIRFVLEKALARQGLATRSFDRAAQVTQALAECQAAGGAGMPRVLLSDIRMPGESGLQLLQSLHAQYPQLRIIIMTAYADLESTVSAFQRGAFEYLSKPFDLDRALALVQRALQARDEEREDEPRASAATEILGQAAAMQDVFRMIGRRQRMHIHSHIHRKPLRSPHRWRACPRRQAHPSGRSRWPSTRAPCWKPTTARSGRC